MDRNPLMRKYLVVGIILFFVMVIPLNTTSFLISIYNVKEVKPISNSSTTDSTTSFYGNMSGQKFWYAIKATFFQKTNITIEHRLSYSSNGSSKNFFFESYNGSNWLLYGGVWWSMGANPDNYFQVHLGRLNWSYYHHDNLNIANWGCQNATIYFRNITGTCFFIYESYTTNCSFNIWVNTSETAKFSISQGTEVFAYNRNDFFGNINIGWKRGTVIVNGLKEINIKNRLFAYFDTGVVLTGFEKLAYQSPRGEYNWRYLVDIGGQCKYSEQSDFFGDNLWWGLNGNWSFMVDMMNMGLLRFYPNIYLFGADVRLPE